MGMSVQFVGISNVMQSFEDRKIEAWAIFVHKQMLTKGWGADQLEPFLRTLDQSGTNAIYTLKVYEDIADENAMKKIKSNTPDDGAVNFRLDPDTAFLPQIAGTRLERIQYREQNRLALDERLKNIEDVLKKITEEKEEEIEEEEETIGSILLDMIKNPSKASALVSVIKELTSPGSGTAQTFTPPMPSTVGNVATPQDRENRLDRLAAAIDILEKQDPNLIDHLEKLAIMAQDKPKKFETLLSMLEMM